MCFIYFWLHWVLAAAHGLSRVQRAGASHSGGFSLLSSTGSVLGVHGLSCSVACGISLDQGLNLCPLHWQLESQPLDSKPVEVQS